LFNKLCKVTDRYLDVSLQFVGAVPQDEFLKKAVQKQQPVVEAFPQSKSALAIKNLAKKIDRWPIKPQTAGYLEFFVERMIRFNTKENAA
jgi:flagellar biosynthesis protein FlhG